MQRAVGFQLCCYIGTFRFRTKLLYYEMPNLLFQKYPLDWMLLENTINISESIE